MKMLPSFAAILIFACLSALSVTHASDAAYPNRPINLVVPFTAGGPTDAMARLLAQKLGERLEQQVVIDNRGGAGGSIAAEMVARAQPDGYTLFFGTTGTMAINPSLYQNLRYDPLNDFAPISVMATTMNVLVVRPDMQATTLNDLVALAKDKPETLTYGSAGTGSSNHLSGELFRTASDINILHIPYKGSAPAMIDLLGGRISMMFDTIAQQTQNIGAGKVTALAVTGPTRSPLLPDVPTAQESGLDGFDVTIWFGLLAPQGVSADIVNRLQSEIEAVMATDEMKKRMLDAGAEAHTTTPAQFTDLIKHDIAKWEPVVKGSGASQE